jgi:hypothetical protein
MPFQLPFPAVPFRSFSISALIVIVLMCLCDASVTLSQDVDFCNATDAELNQILHNHPEENDMAVIHALKTGLCVKVDQGHLEMNEASIVFESAAETMVAELHKMYEKKNKICNLDMKNLSILLWIYFSP